MRGSGSREMTQRGRVLRAWLIACLTVTLDQLTKSLVVHSFAVGQSRPLLPPLVQLTYIQNTGAAFGLLKGQHLLFVGLSLCVIGWIVWELLSRPAMTRTVLWGCAFVLGGAVGNLIDRLSLGYVVDFIDLRVWPVFNVGDSAITIGVGLLIAHSLFASGGRGKP